MSKISFGAKNLRDLWGVSSSPFVAIAQKQLQPDGPRAEGSDTGSEIPAPAMTPTGSKTAEKSAGTIFETLKRFAPSDYVSWISEYLRYRFGPKHEFLTYNGKQPADGIYPLDAGGGEIRIGLAGDWGTGTDEAYKIGHLIGAFVPHYTIHLGDVYFVGDPTEVEENVLGRAKPHSRFTPCKWPLGSKASFALNGNHEMYARGFAYFDRILPAMGEIKDGVPQGQLASFFCLRNDEWCILGLDTGYNSVGTPITEDIWIPDASLPDPVMMWLQAIASKLDNRALIILTHHQVLSAYQDGFTKQADQVFSMFNRAVLWFWGHEHRMAIYQPFEARDRTWPTIMGRCIGHGGMPVDPPSSPKPGLLGEVEFTDKRLYANDENLHVGVNGMMLMTIDGPSLNLDYVDVYGQSVFRESFVAQDGIPVRRSFTNLHLSTP
jgi:Calcineurin-like phosphoesterase